jgi:hypothetical protein
VDQVIVRTGPPQVEPEIAELVKPIIAKWELAALRVAAAHSQPAKFKLPAGANTPEGILAARFKLLPAARKQRSGQRAQELLAQRNRKRPLGGLLNLDLAVAQSVDTLVKAPVPKLSAEAAAEIAGRHFLQLGFLPSFGLPFPFKHLNFNLVRVRCIDETNGLFGSEAGDDEIELGGTCVDETGDTTKIAPFKVGDFSDGDVKTYSPPKRLQTFNVGEGTEYPKSYFVNLVLNEADQGNFSETMEKVFKKVQDEVSARLAAALGGAVGSSGGPVGVIIGMAVGYAVGKVFNLILRAWEDDPFKPVTIQVVIPSADAKLPARSDFVAFTGPGEYHLRYSWTLTDLSKAAVKGLRSAA